MPNQSCNSKSVVHLELLVRNILRFMSQRGNKFLVTLVTSSCDATKHSIASGRRGSAFVNGVAAFLYKV